MESDIVTRLREATVPRLEMGWPAPHVVQRKEPLWIEAAEEIERLRAELAAAIKERDEARRDVCGEIARIRAAIEGVFDPKRVAINRGWDCFERGGA